MWVHTCPLVLLHVPCVFGIWCVSVQLAVLSHGCHTLFGTIERQACDSLIGCGWSVEGWPLHISSKNFAGDNDAANMVMRSNLFGNIRLALLFFVFACASVVLGLSANLSAHLLPYDGGLLIFSLVASGATIVVVWILALRSTPSFESFVLFVLSALWLTMGAMTVDRIGSVQCFDLSGNLKTNQDQTMDAAEHCRIMKTVEAFSWALFVVFISMFLLVLSLTIRARSHGAGSLVWRNSISDLPWFGQWMDGNQNHYYYNNYPQYSLGHSNQAGMMPQHRAPSVVPIQGSGSPNTIVIPQHLGHQVHLQRDHSGNLTNIIQTPVH